MSVTQLYVRLDSSIYVNAVSIHKTLLPHPFLGFQVTLSCHGVRVCGVLCLQYAPRTTVVHPKWPLRFDTYWSALSLLF